MFVRIKKAGRYEYLQVVENHREKGKSVQRVIATLGRMDHLRAKGEIEHIARSLSRFSEPPLLLLSEKSGEVRTGARIVGPSLLFDGLWQKLGLSETLREPVGESEDSIEDAACLATLWCLFPDGRNLPSRWDLRAGNPGRSKNAMPSLPPAFALLGISRNGSGMARDAVEQELFRRPRELKSQKGPSLLCLAPFTMPHGSGAPDRVAGVVLDREGYPLCSEVWTGPALEPESLTLFLERIRRRFAIDSVRIVSEHPAIGPAAKTYLEKAGISCTFLTSQGEDHAGRTGGRPPDTEALVHEVLPAFEEMLVNGLRGLSAGTPAREPDTSRGVVLASFLALVVRKELDHALHGVGHSFTWGHIRESLGTLQEVTVEDNGRKLTLFTDCTETCRAVLRATGTTIPSPLRQAP
jgi:hypothetical protein